MRARVVREPGGAFELEAQTTRACGLCHSDALVKSAQFPELRLPRVPGHALTDAVDALGEGVDALQLGDRPGVGWHGGHGFKCDCCRRGDFIHCDSAAVFSGARPQIERFPLQAANEACAKPMRNEIRFRAVFEIAS